MLCNIQLIKGSAAIFSSRWVAGAEPGRGCNYGITVIDFPAAIGETITKLLKGTAVIAQIDKAGKQGINTLNEALRPTF
jgi:hypothetical protein